MLKNPESMIESTSSMTHRQHVLLGSVEEKDQVVSERLVRLQQDVNHLQHDCATHGVVTRTLIKLN